MTFKIKNKYMQASMSSVGLPVLLAFLMLPGISPAQEVTRKVMARTAPTYPEMAKKMHLSGKVRVEVVVAPNGSVTSAKLIGGSPVFEKSAVDAVKQWRFEPADHENKGIIVLEFEDH